MKKALFTLAGIVLLAACRSDPLGPNDLTYTAQVSTTQATPAVFRITGSVKNDTQAAIRLPLGGGCGNIGFRLYVRGAETLKPAFEFDPALGICSLIAREVVLNPGDVYPFDVTYGPLTKIPSGSYRVTVVFFNSRNPKEVTAGDVAIQ